MRAAPTSNSETVMASPNLLTGFAINEQPATSKQHLTESILGVGECWWFDWRGRSSSPSGLELLAAPASLAPLLGLDEAFGSTVQRGAAANLHLLAPAPSPRSSDPYHAVTTVHLALL